MFYLGLRIYKDVFDLLVQNEYKVASLHAEIWPVKVATEQ